ncbi:MAG TPA: hypothetical protein VG889_07145 [Rhizomicrobium sp.]|nr:hypothetical protein [Rhizomicrobium sp.]
MDIEKELDTLLVAYGVKSKRTRAGFVRAFSGLAKRARNGGDIRAVLENMGVLAEANANRPPPLPDKAPMLYAERPDKSQNIVEFLLHGGWGPWVKRGALPRKVLLKLDPQAYAALANHVKRYGLPPGVRIPTRSELVDDFIEKNPQLSPALAKMSSALVSRVRVRGTLGEPSR